MPLEIQDSDDDFAVTSPTRPDEENETSPVKVVPEPNASRTKSTNGTTSTDRLMQEIQHAQQQLIGSSPARSTYTLREPTSSPLRANKRRKTTNSSQVSTPEKKLGRRKTVKTYGSSSKRTRGLVDSESSLFDELKADEQRSTGATITQKDEDELAKNPAENTWDLLASIRQDFQEHEPVSMFPDPSSTVPDNSMTQQRLIEEALSNQMLPPSIQQAEETAASTTSSIPWSTYLESTEHKPETPAKITQISQMLIPDEPASAVDPKLLTKNALLHVDPSNTPPGSPVKATRLSKSPTSSSTNPSSSKLRRTKTMGAKTLSRNPGELDDELAMDKPKSTARRRKSHVAQSMSRNINENIPTAPIPVDRALAEKIVMMLSTAPSDDPPETAKQAIVQVPEPVVQEQQKRKEKEKAPGDEAVTLNYDDLVIGLSEEQYKPRPSRSRSSRIAEDTSIDYSKRPERVATSKLKRRKTTNEVSLRSPPAKVDAEKMAQIGSMGFTPRQTKAALMESSGNIERAIDHLIAQSSGGKENSPSKPSKTRSKSTKEPEVSVVRSEFLGVEVTQGSSNRDVQPTVDLEAPKHDVSEKQDKEKDLEDEIGLDSAPLPVTKPPEEDVPTKKPSTQKRRRDKVIDSDEEDDFVAEPEPPKRALKPAAKRTKSLPAKKPQIIDEKDDLAVTAPKTTTQPVEENKRGRGRPRKVVEAVADADPLEPHIAEPEIPKVDAKKVTPPKSLEPRKVSIEPEQPKDETQPPIAIPKNGAIPPSTPEQHSGSSQKSAAVKAAAQHSPLNKSKVPLRVGLSRKNRIAPLLRIIKK